jgi:hypothetical protein
VTGPVADGQLGAPHGPVEPVVARDERATGRAAVEEQRRVRAGAYCDAAVDASDVDRTGAAR